MMQIMRVVSLIAILLGAGVFLYGLFTPSESWLIGYGFVLTVASTIGSLGFLATDHPDSRAVLKNSHPPLPITPPKRNQKRAA